VSIDHRAVVADGARIHPTAEIGPFAVIGPQVEIGAGCRIDAHAVVTGHTSLGARCHVFSFGVVGSPPQDKKYQGEAVRLEIGDDNTIREFTTINPGTGAGGGITRIGHRNLLMAYVHVAHDCIIGDDNVLSNGAQLAGHVVIADRVIIGGMSGVHQFVHIGRGAMLGGGSMLTQDLPPYLIAAGNRADLHGLNLVGLKRADVPPASIAALKESYRLIFRQKKPIQSALADAAAAHGSDPLVAEMIEFIRASERGVARANRDDGE
jgi:UDP-N-acetylglucosamine acyltransferase